MKKIFAVILLLMNLQAMAQHSFDISKDTKDEGLIYNGQITFSDLNKEPSFKWLKSGYDEYMPKPELLRYLNENLKNYSMVVFLGTWCDDSHYLVPKLEKVLDLVGVAPVSLTMYGVDRDKHTKGGEYKTYDITLVPTIILLRDNKEVGRITESVQNNLEGDLVAMIRKDKATSGQ
jgi:thiol-disulfide isomerase/thioredoxin